MIFSSSREEAGIARASRQPSGPQHFYCLLCIFLIVSTCAQHGEDTILCGLTLSQVLCKEHSAPKALCHVFQKSNRGSEVKAGCALVTGVPLRNLLTSPQLPHPLEYFFLQPLHPHSLSHSTCLPLSPPRAHSGTAPSGRQSGGWQHPRAPAGGSLSLQGTPGSLRGGEPGGRQGLRGERSYRAAPTLSSCLPGPHSCPGYRQTGDC